MVDTTMMSSPGPNTNASQGGTSSIANNMMMDHDDKYGKRDKQLKRGFAILGITSCLLIGIIIGTVLIQQEQDLRKRSPSSMQLLRHVSSGNTIITTPPNALEYSKADPGGIGLFRKPIKRTEPMDKNVKDQPPPLTRKGDAVPTIRPKHVEEQQERDEEDDKENEDTSKDENEEEDEKEEEEIDGDDKEEEDEEEEEDGEDEEKDEEEEKGDEKEEDDGTKEEQAEEK